MCLVPFWIPQSTLSVSRHFTLLTCVLKRENTASFSPNKPSKHIRRSSSVATTQSPYQIKPSKAPEGSGQQKPMSTDMTFLPNILLGCSGFDRNEKAEEKQGHKGNAVSALYMRISILMISGDFKRKYS